MSEKNATTFLQGVLTRLRRDLSQELYALFLIGVTNKKLIAALMLVLTGLVVYLSPLPPRTVYLTGAEPGTANAILAEKMKVELQKYGIDLIPVNRANRAQYAEDIQNNLKNEMNLYVAGGAPPEDSRLHVSLGSIQYSPLWLFYRGQKTTTEKELPKRMSIGPDGSSTQKIYRELEASHGISHDSGRYLTLDHLVAAEELLNGKIDAMFLVDGYDSPLVQKLVHAKDIKVFSFDLADAYDRIFPHYNKLVVPRGLFDSNPVEPVKNLDLLTTTVTLLVDKELHPVVQWAMLKAARDISLQRKQVFADPGFFPVYLDRTFPISKIAEQYYQKGMPMLYGKLSLWLSVLLDQIWFELLTVFAILIPIWALLPFARQYYFETVIQAAYLKFQMLDEQMKQANCKEDFEHILAELQALDRDTGSIWYSTNNLRFYYVLKATHIRNMILDVKTEIARFSTHSS